MQLPPGGVPTIEALIVDTKNRTQNILKINKDENNRLKICFHLF